MSEDIRAQFFPTALPAGVIRQSVDRATGATEIQALNIAALKAHYIAGLNCRRT